MNRDSSLKYVDDFLLIGRPGTDECVKQIPTMDSTTDDLGVPLAGDKRRGPATVMKFLGIILDSVAQTLSLPHSRLREIINTLKAWSKRTTFTLRDLQQLHGVLSFASKCIPASRLFTRRLVQELRMKFTGSRPVTKSMQLDIQWWLTFLPKWNGTASFLQPNWDHPEVMQLYTDASRTHGFGAFYNGRWFNGRWPTWIQRVKAPIEYLEMIPILLVLLVWGREFRCRKVRFHCDNEGATFAWENYRSSNPVVLDLMRRMVAVAAEHNFTLTLKHIRGVNNSTADALSRFQMQRFRSLAPSSAPQPCLYPDIWNSLHRSYRN